MNIAEILKNVPRGTKLYSPIFGDVIFEEIRQDYIRVKTINIIREFYSDGKYYANGECMLFPSRENRDWDNFYICPFKKGDFIAKEGSGYTKFLAIFSHFGGPYEYTTNYLCLLRPNGEFKPKADFGIGDVQEARLATYSEKKELLDAIKRNGYTWNSNTLTLEKLEDKFDITTFKPFDKVLCRDYNSEVWKCDIFSHSFMDNRKLKFICIGTYWLNCIPYNDDTKHLVGTDKDCPEYYKTW